MKCCVCCFPFVTIFASTLWCASCIDMWRTVCSEHSYSMLRQSFDVREV